ncbi:MAG TPA: RNA-protein complex protein Nop10 [Methanocorpusculum sp.]|nr:RNA-protein complex protein Nop10 [Candidatus Methanocorpusculum equi]MCQ2357858.1 RNA-protein complex protein Nop10 [Methanocorpusculum sp.]HJJ33438.1 RNA-protein complex protein Nop10 [Methanocorpusculum sp.]HJJ44879.1 RNA-protein complex protein Nop10 [Methanocorpusculum sp.]HJJ58146.1 RNA-protein complex protein Nop10 [Methanocorpusculum sp.]
MHGHIRECKRDHVYTFLETCPVCGEPTTSVHPPRYSPQDRYGKYRRMIANKLNDGTGK